jgi:hypothetical protein
MEPTKLRKALPWIGTHLVALAAGMWLFRPDVGASPAANDGGKAQAAATAAAVEEGAAPGAAGASRGRASLPRPAHDGPPAASVHHLAWKALAYDGLDRPERLKASALILKEWIKEDWHAALDTVMKEPPDDYELLVHFEDVFRRDAGEVWSVIESKRYGVTTARLKGRWLGTIRQMEDEQRRKTVEGLPEEARKAIEESMKR